MDEPFFPYPEITRLQARARRVLGVGPEAGRHEIRAAFRALAQARHPDLGGDPDAFTQVVNAYLVLTRPDPRGFAVADPGDEEPGPGPEYRAWWLRRFFDE